ncbi:hypothetical protein PC119_g15552 [Phytophthora cactorum]|nr:hypothetical protein PC119_g15552 [Phytophthora cactorum]
MLAAAPGRLLLQHLRRKLQGGDVVVYSVCDGSVIGSIGSSRPACQKLQSVTESPVVTTLWLNLGESVKVACTRGTRTSPSKSQASLTCGPTRSESEQAAAKAKRELGSEAYASTRERSLQILRGGAQATAELPTRATVRDTNEENEPHVDGVVHSVYGATDELDVELIRVDQPSSDTRSYWVKATLYYTRSTVTNGGKQRRALPGYSPRSRLTYRIWRAI